MLSNKILRSFAGAVLLKAPNQALSILPLRQCRTVFLAPHFLTANTKAPSHRNTRTLAIASQLKSFSSSMSSELQIVVVPCLPGSSNNYAYLLHDSISNLTAVVDPTEAGPINAELSRRGWTLTHVLNTHHHWDHTGGNNSLKQTHAIKIVGPAEDKERIPGIDIALSDNSTWQFGAHAVHVMHTPGHTKGHACYYIPSAKAVFTGDTLFSLGCGRLFEGTPQQMWTSLSRLANLPHETNVYCGHEYTQSNAKFALSIEPGNPALVRRSQEVDKLRQKGIPTIPSTISEELEANPFLRPESEEIRGNLGISQDASVVEVFGAIREAKDSF